MAEKKLLCWNVNGIRAIKKKGFFDWFYKESPEILCLQETKVNLDQLDEDFQNLKGYKAYWAYPERKGYSGVAVFTKDEPREVQYDFGKGFDVEGRVIIAVYPWFTLFNIYYPNGKSSPDRLRYKMEFYDAFLKYIDALKAKGEKLVVCGDVNTAHKEIDLARPRENSKSSGFLPEERAWMDKLISHGFLDTFRRFNPEPGNYSYWDIKTGARARNVGWRIDYFFVSENLLPALTSAFIRKDVMGSDHCPIGITLKV